MKETEEKYLNFDGISSEVPNDMPWGDTHWSGMSGTDWQQDGFVGTNWQDVNLNASGSGLNRPDIIPARGSDAYNVTTPAYSRGSDAYNVTTPAYSRGSDAYTETEPHANFLPSGEETITLGHHQNLRPNMDLVLGDNDNNTMPDSDIWSNHPGFLGGTWWRDFWFPTRAEADRAAKARESIDSQYPITGSCDILTASEASINASLDHHSKATKRGPKRVAKRTIPILNNKLKTVSTNRQIQCDSEAEDQIQDDQLNMFMQQQMQEPKKEEGVSATNVILGLVIIGGLVWGISKLAKPGAPAAVAVAPAPPVA